MNGRLFRYREFHSIEEVILPPLAALAKETYDAE